MIYILVGLFIASTVGMFIGMRYNKPRIVTTSCISVCITLLLFFICLHFNLFWETYIPTNEFRIVYSEDQGFIMEREWRQVREWPKIERFIKGPESKWKFYISIDDIDVTNFISTEDPDYYYVTYKGK